MLIRKTTVDDEILLTSFNNYSIIQSSHFLPNKFKNKLKISLNT